jgi:hypothetical protein
MPFALDADPTMSEVSDAVNYLLANFGPNLSADPNTGQITGPSGIVIAYLYRYLSVKYADSFDGSLNFSNTPTNRGYYGVNNSDSSTESTNPADYIWYKVAGGFGTTKFLFYQVTGGRSINFVVTTTAPSGGYIKDSGVAIDLDIITSGAQANSATTAYLIQSQSDPAPSGFPLYTSGNTLPPGWSATLGTVSVGQVAWYTFGQYNGSTIAVNGIPANSTYWSTPVAASIFQDIRSDNWNGSNPPTYGTPSTYGTQGYYISQATGNVFFNNGIYRGDISTDGDAYFEGKNPAGVLIPGFNQYADYSSYSYAFSSTTSSNIRVGALGRAGATVAYANVGVLGEAVSSGNSWGVVGIGQWVGGSFFATGTGATALQSSAATLSSPALDVSFGVMKISNSTLVTNLNADYLDGQHGSYYLPTTGTAADSNALGGVAASGWARIFVGNTGTANAAGSGMNFSVTFAGYQFRGTSNIMYLETVSDERIKKDIEPEKLGLDFINQLKPVTYRMKEGVQTKFHGFIAQDVEGLITGEGDSLKTENSDGIKGVDYISLIAPLTKAVQELTARVQELEKKNGS